MRSIYGSVLVHLYDTSTDIAILISWGIYTRQELEGTRNIENVNMLSFLIPSVLLILIYRAVYAVAHFNVFHNSAYMLPSDFVLILLDLYIFKLVYEQFTLQYLS
eukprot:360939_1